MDVSEPHVRRRGFLITRDIGDEGFESDNAEGVPIRIGAARPRVRRHLVVGAGTTTEPPAPLDLPSNQQKSLADRRLRSASGTGHRLPLHMRH